jgi:hypothetical protein
VEVLGGVAFVVAERDREVGYDRQLCVFCYQMLVGMVGSDLQPGHIKLHRQLLTSSILHLLNTHNFREMYYSGELGLVLACKEIRNRTGIKL